MNWIRKVIFWWSEEKPKVAKTPEPGFETYHRYFENVEGDFYVQSDACIACGAPESVAPDLIGHSELNNYHCYFKKQPQTENELDRAVDAVRVACCAGVRYGGTDENILKRLYELGAETECDQKPLTNYKIQ